MRWSAVTRRRGAAAALAMIAIVVMGVGMALPANQPRSASQNPLAQAPESQAPPTVISTRCEQVTIYSGTKGLASWRYGEVVKNLLEGAGPTSQRGVRFDRSVRVVMDENSDGSIYNIKKLAEGESNPDCRLGFAQMNVAADAVEGFDVFKEQPVPELRAVGPLTFDVLHIIVRRESPVRDAANLCGQAVSTHGTSGAAQLLRLLARLSGNPNCEIRTNEKYKSLDGLEPSAASDVAAVVWSSAGVPNKTLKEKAEKTDIRLLPVEDFKRIFQDDWDRVYGTLPERGRKYYGGEVFEDVVIEEGYYRGVPTMSAFGVPSGLVVRAAADSGLVRFLTRALSEERAAFQQALWGENTADRNERSFPGPELVSQNPLFCYVQPHAAAEDFYRKVAAEGGYTYQGQCGD